MFANKCSADKRKLLVKELRTKVDNLFIDSLDEVQAMSPSEHMEKKSNVPIIFHVKMGSKRPINEMFDPTAQKFQRIIEDDVTDNP